MGGQVTLIFIFRMHTENHLHTLPGCASKVCVGGGGWWVESEFSDRRWLSSSLALAKPTIKNQPTSGLGEIFKKMFTPIIFL